MESKILKRMLCLFLALLLGLSPLAAYAEDAGETEEIAEIVEEAEVMETTVTDEAGEPSDEAETSDGSESANEALESNDTEDSEEAQMAEDAQADDRSGDESETESEIEMESESETADSYDEVPEDMVLVAQNEYLSLYLDKDETDLAVVDNATGKIWYTNPQGAEEDETASSYYKRVLKSQLKVTYYNDSVQSSSMDNYNDSIMDEQFEITYLDDGVTITYTIGELSSLLLLPNAISETNMLAWMENMSETGLKKINRNYTLIDPVNGSDVEDYLESYPGFGDECFYVLRSSVKDYLKEELAEYFAEAGYTQEDYEADLVASGAGDEESEDPWFIIPLTYRLEDDNLVVTLDPETVEYNEDGYYLVNIDILPYFGASDVDDGYSFVPDGSGALIYFNNGKTSSSSYAAMVYGTDVSTQVLSSSKSEIDASLTVKMPVFGIKAGEQALFAIIEEGSGYATIKADVGGSLTSYNDVYSGYAYLQYGSASLSDMVGANSYQLYGEAQFAESYQIRYAFLTGDEADYSGMAAYYRNYLEEQGVLVRNTDEDELPFYVEFIGAIDKYKTLVGVKYNAVVALTTYAQAEQILSELDNLGITSPSVIYSGWMNGGLRGTAALNVSPVSALEKGGTSLKEFQEDMSAAGIETFMTVEYQYVYETKLINSYSAMAYGPLYFDRSNITVKDYVLADGTVDGTLANLISPYFSDKVTDVLTKAISKYGITGINLGSVCNYLYSDFNENRYTDRQTAIGLYQDSIETLSESVSGLLGDNSSIYTVAYTDDIINVPLSSNEYMILDEDIPFYQMVLHGYVRYAGEALNLADDYTTTFLKSVESGAGLYFEWIYADNSEVTETEFDYLYSVNYQTWLETAAEDYANLSEALAGLENQLIVKHEILEENLTRTTYEDGTEVYVNFSKNEMTCDGVTVSAKSFTVVKGSE